MARIKTFDRSRKHIGDFNGPPQVFPGGLQNIKEAVGWHICLDENVLYNSYGWATDTTPVRWIVSKPFTDYYEVCEVLTIKNSDGAVSDQLLKEHWRFDNEDCFFYMVYQPTPGGEWVLADGNQGNSEGSVHAQNNNNSCDMWWRLPNGHTYTVSLLAL